MSAPVSSEDHCRRVLLGELRGATDTARSDLDWLQSAIESARRGLDGDGPHRGNASQLSQSARSATESLMRVDIVLGKLEGVNLLSSLTGAQRGPRS